MQGPMFVFRFFIRGGVPNEAYYRAVSAAALRSKTLAAPDQSEFSLDATPQLQTRVLRRLFDRLRQRPPPLQRARALQLFNQGRQPLGVGAPARIRNPAPRFGALCGCSTTVSALERTRSGPERPNWARSGRRPPSVNVRLHDPQNSRATEFYSRTAQALSENY